MERCQDSSCGYENRLEYCVDDARDPNGYVSYVIAALDELLYENEQVASDTFVLETDSNDQYMQRSFSLSHFDPQTWILPTNKTSIAITHHISKKLRCESYCVTVGWVVEREECSSDPFIMKYAIDVYPNGDVQAELVSPNFSIDSEETTMLTNYDYEQLYKVLDLLALSQRAERADNVRAQAA